MHFYGAQGMLLAGFEPESATSFALLQAVPQAKPIGDFLAPTQHEGYSLITMHDQLVALQENNLLDWDQLY